MIESVAPSAPVGDEPIELRINITKEDHIKSVVIDSRRIIRGRSDISRMLRRREAKRLSVGALVAAIPAAYIAYAERASLSYGGFLIVYVLTLLAFSAAIKAGKLIFMPLRSKVSEAAVIANATAQADMIPGLLGNRTVSLSASDFSTSTRDAIRKYMWTGIEYVAESKSEFFISPEVGTSVIPKRGLSDATITAQTIRCLRLKPPMRHVFGCFAVAVVSAQKSESPDFRGKPSVRWPPILAVADARGAQKTTV
jgi:hypothetical protein